MEVKKDVEKKERERPDESPAIAAPPPLCSLVERERDSYIN